LGIKRNTPDIPDTTNTPEEFNRIDDVPVERTEGLLEESERSLLRLMEKLNPCDQRYYIGEKAFLITYRRRINLLSFLKRGRIPYTLRIVGFPVSLVKKGYFGDLEEISNMIQSLKGFTLVLNADGDLDLPRGYTLSSFVLPIVDRNLEEYLERMRSPYRYRLKKALEKGKLYRVRRMPGEEFSQELYELYLDVYQRSEAPLECLPMEFFKEMPGEIYVFESSHEGSSDKRSSYGGEKERAIGFLLLAHQQETLNFLFGGFLEKDVKAYDLYYGMLLEMVRIAMEKGARFLELGQTAEESKAKMGAKEMEKHLYLTHSNPLIRKILPKLLHLGSYQPGVHRYRVFKEAEKDGQQNTSTIREGIDQQR